MKKLLIAGYGDIARGGALAKGRILPARVVYVSTPPRVKGKVSQ